MHNSIVKNGAENFSIEIITFTHTQEVADFWEAYFIQKYDSIKNGYNIREGGSRGKATESTKRKMSISLTGKIKSEAAKQKISKSMKGKVFSKETLEKISIAMTGKKQSKETCDKKSLIQKGHLVSSETRRKISEKLSYPRKISKADVQEILCSNRSNEELSIKYGVSSRTIRRYRRQD